MGVIGPDDPRLDTVRLLNDAVMFVLSLETIRAVPRAKIDRALEAWESAMVALLNQPQA